MMGLINYMCRILYRREGVPAVFCLVDDLFLLVEGFGKKSCQCRRRRKLGGWLGGGRRGWSVGRRPVAGGRSVRNATIRILWIQIGAYLVL